MATGISAALLLLLLLPVLLLVSPMLLVAVPVRTGLYHPELAVTYANLAPLQPGPVPRL